MAANMLIKRNIFAKLGIWDSKNETKIDYVNTDFTEISSQHTNDRVSAHNEISDKEAGSVSSKPTSPSKNINAVKEKALPPTKNHVFKTPSIIAPNKGLSHEVDATEVSLAKDAIVMIKKQVALANEEQKVYNEERYGAVSSNTTILLVQVHNRLENLRYLVESMKKVRGIEETLVIFSHDFWDAAINDFVRNISTFRVMQIFFPFSIQLHPFSYPGRDPRDCSWNVPRVEEMQCLNHRWPDTYGHYREASFTQIKHHWWWKIHRVFEGVNVTRVNYTGTVVFLEEDHYLLPDLLHVLRLLQQHRASSCSSCQVLTLGNYNKLGLSVYRNFIERGDWWVTKHNLGFALDAAAWNTLSKCKKFFCTFDDYNWDWTLNNVVQTCASPRMSMLSARLTRVMHVGSWDRVTSWPRLFTGPCSMSFIVSLLKAMCGSCLHYIALQTIPLPDNSVTEEAHPDILITHLSFQPCCVTSLKHSVLIHLVNSSQNFTGYYHVIPPPIPPVLQCCQVEFPEPLFVGQTPQFRD
nr:alpha-1,6-mannosyl-glycoprotein 2-beta-N-acetylglucosaminyltransferase-like [Cherax quadricarinatus]XP_053642466.1 alpha-1,6-mannosyl-glycoprotein 2-beta-N-acetylglucosaminyltransferase-like [Cherax quadricarinatus]XP_053642477.1 alpha-1,6-mannosyl-glycoprotein 2-beta-N-acetylglucosaminyltransferase-like [Cherax quadricarinatus]XP_053642486.1 alpha-1,6-mannosyl-glycoprotein 2-beta-N-acetylglucosaminyltransferase-like [Cherax quadricarinatus]